MTIFGWSFILSFVNIKKMKNGLTIIYQNDDNYMLGEITNGVINGWGTIVDRENGNDIIIRGYFKDGKLDGIGSICRFTENGAEETTGLFKNGEYISIEEIKKTYPSSNYDWVPDYNGDYHAQPAIWYGEMGNDNLPHGFGMMEYNNHYFFLYYDEEGYRVGLFYFQIEGNKYGEHLYTPTRTKIGRKEWMYIRVAGLYLKANKLVKKYS